MKLDMIGQYVQKLKIFRETVIYIDYRLDYEESIQGNHPKNSEQVIQRYRIDS
jgi:hypothetical protein